VLAVDIGILRDVVSDVRGIRPVRGDPAIGSIHEYMVTERGARRGHLRKRRSARFVIGGDSARHHCLGLIGGAARCFGRDLSRQPDQESRQQGGQPKDHAHARFLEAGCSKPPSAAGTMAGRRCVLNRGNGEDCVCRRL
jgi:hypothetical protein